MIWLASFPRSGNTFTRNILYHVYGLESCDYGRIKKFGQPDYKPIEEFPIVKIHDLPDEVEDLYPEVPSIYLIRDGRDSLVSMAHHRKDIVVPGSKFQINLMEAIIAARRSFQGGWSLNADMWASRASVIIRYEDLIKDPIGQLERLRKFTELREPNRDELPTFEKQRQGLMRYGSKKPFKVKDELIENYSERFFRKGVVGSWKEEFTPELEELFWSIHGETMLRFGYQRNGEVLDMDPDLVQKDYYFIEKPKAEARILIDANKLFDEHIDGIKRYSQGLLWAYYKLNLVNKLPYEIDLYLGEFIVPLTEYYDQQLKPVRPQEKEKKPPVSTPFFYEKLLLNFKNVATKLLPASLYKAGRKLYKDLPIRSILARMRAKYSTKLHKSKMDSYDLIHVLLPQNFFLFDELDHKFVLTVHDLTHHLFPEYHADHNVQNCNIGFKIAQAKSTSYIAISEQTRKDLSKTYDIDTEQIEVIGEAADHERFYVNYDEGLSEKVMDFYSVQKDGYFFCLSTIEPRKNLINTIKAFQLFVKDNPDSNLLLLIGGKKGWKTKELFDVDIDEARIKFIGYVPDQDLCVLYNNAAAYCYLSHYEGFGLPLLEAMRCKTAVLYGDNSAMKEVAGDAGYACDPNDPIQIKDQMNLLVRDPILREVKVSSAYTRALDFTWEKTALRTLESYKNALK